MITGLNAPLQATSVNAFKDLACDWVKVKYYFHQYKEMSNDTKAKRVLDLMDDIEQYVYSIQ